MFQNTDSLFQILSKILMLLMIKNLPQNNVSPTNDTSYLFIEGQISNFKKD